MLTLTKTPNNIVERVIASFDPYVPVTITWTSSYKTSPGLEYVMCSGKESIVEVKYRPDTNMLVELIVLNGPAVIDTNPAVGFPRDDITSLSNTCLQVNSANQTNAVVSYIEDGIVVQLVKAEGSYFSLCQNLIVKAKRGVVSELLVPWTAIDKNLIASSACC